MSLPDAPFGQEQPPRLSIASAQALMRAVGHNTLDSEAASGGVDSPTDVSAPEAVGSHLPHLPGYILDRRIGGGSGGVVYRGFREGSDMPVAIKILLSPIPSARENTSETHERDDAALNKLQTPSGTQRAWRELQALSELRLPCVPRLLDFGVIDGRVFLVTEHVKGEQLDAHCLPLRSSLRDRVQCMVRVADAVQSLHEHAVLHRDIKPSNILVTHTGDPVVLDLGIAAALSPDGQLLTMAGHGTLTAEGLVLGTPAYMAPEQARGERSRISVRTDVYGLGATAYAALTGGTPHDCDTSVHEAVRRVSGQPPRDPIGLTERMGWPRIPRPLALVLLKACDPQSESRYPSAQAFADDLRRWLRGEPVVAAPPTWVQRIARWATAHPRSATATVCAAITMSTIGASSVVIYWQNSLPDRIVRLEDGRVHRLITPAGRTLAQWTSTETNHLPHTAEVAGPFRRDPKVGGGHVVVSRMGAYLEQPQLSGQLCVWDASRLDKPLWTAPSRLVPPTGITYSDDAYSVTTFCVADIFPSQPGQEIAVAHATGHVPSAIRVYDMGGEVLYEAWHYGSIGRLRWFVPDGGPAQLICSALNNERRFDEWGYDRSIDAKQLTMHPVVVFALQPTLHARGGMINGWYRVREPRAAPDPTVAALWYKALWPLEIYDHFDEVQLGAPPGSGRRHRAVAIIMQRFGNRSTGAVNLDVDSSGRVIFRDASDAWHRSAIEGLDWREIDLIDWPIPVGPRAVGDTSGDGSN